MTKEVIVERTVDQLGRIVLPKDMRKMYNIDIDSKVILTATDEGIIITNPSKTKEQA